MAEKNLIPIPINLIRNEQYTTLDIAMKRAYETSQNMIGNWNFIKASNPIPFIAADELLRNVNQSSKDECVENYNDYAKSFNKPIFQSVFNAQRALLNTQLDDQNVIPFLLNKIISKLIHEHTKKDYKKYSFESDGLNSSFYFNPDFTIDEVMILNDKINEKLIELTDIFEMDDLLKFSFVVTAEDLSDKETFVTSGMHCG